MFSKIICYKGFWPSVIFLSAMFIIIYNLADWGMVFDFDFQAYTKERFASDQLLRFLFANILSGLVYGFIVSFFKFRSKIKRQNQNKV
jgi:hypothetical protein